jgi:hypothetical protein
VKSLLLVLFLAAQQTQPPSSKTKLSVSPRVAQEPATITFLLRDIPPATRSVCFILDGPNHYQSCRELTGERNIRFEHRNVLEGEYSAGVALDDKILSPAVSVIITG